MKEAIWLVAGGQMQLPLAQHIKSLGYSIVLFARKVINL